MVTDTTPTSPKKKIPISLTIVVPAYNEELGIEGTVKGLTRVLEGVIDDYEILVIDDCSTDRTGELAKALEKTTPRMKYIRNETNQGLGFNYRKGYELASKEWVILVPGDDELNSDSVPFICSFAGRADLVTSYPENFHIRPFMRKVTSLAFTGLMNFISGRKLKYYNGTVLQKKANLMQVSSVTNGFAFQVEILIPMLRSGVSHYEVPYMLNPCDRPTSAFRLKNIISVVGTVLRLAATYKFRILPAPPPRNALEDRPVA